MIRKRNLLDLQERFPQVDPDIVESVYLSQGILIQLHSSLMRNIMYFLCYEKIILFHIFTQISIVHLCILNI